MEDTIGRRDTLGLTPYGIIVGTCGTGSRWTCGRVHTKQEVITGIGDIGAVSIGYFSLKVYLFVHAGRCRNVFGRKQESSHPENESGEEKYVNCILDFGFHRNKKRAEDLVSSSPVSIYFLFSIHQNNGFVKVKKSKKYLTTKNDSAKEKRKKKK